MQVRLLACLLSGIRKISMMVNIRPLPDLLERKAIEELNEVPERIQSDIEALRDWIEIQPHLKSRVSDQFLVGFLRGCKYSLEKAKQKIDKFYALKTTIPELFKNRRVEDVKTFEILNLGVGLPLPQPLGEDGPRISILRVGIYDISKYTLAEIMKVGTMIGDVQILEDDNAVISGMVQIMDFAGVTAGHMFHLNPLFMKSVFTYGEHGVPIRQKGFHFINTPPGFDTVFKSMKSLLSEKTKNRVFAHSNNMESLYQDIPKKYLPADYGGENSNFRDIIKYWEQKLLAYKDYFIEEEQYGTDEALRVGSPIDKEVLGGIYGSFRKLEID